MDAALGIRVGQVEVRPSKLSFRVGEPLSPPAHDGVVVVGAGVGDQVAAVVVGKEVVVGVAAEGELQDGHARKLERISQRPHRVGNDAEVLGDDGKLPKLVLHGTKERGPGPVLPGALNGGVVRGRDAPVFVEASEVVESDDVEQLKRAPQSLRPPFEAALCHPVPPVDRVSPQLALGAEVVGRHAGHHGGGAVVVEPEALLVSPHVGTVGGDVDGQVPEQPDVTGVAVGLQGRPLAVKEVLPVDVSLDRRFVLLAGASKGVRVAAHQGRGPLGPGGPAVGVLQGGVERVVVEPGGLRLPKLLNARRVGGRHIVPKSAEGGAEHLPFARDQARVVDVVVGQLCEGGQVVLRQQPVFHEGLGANQKRVAGERGRAGIGRGAGPDGPHRQHLPQPLVGAGKKVGKLKRGRPEVADAVPAGEGADGKEKAARASRIHGRDWVGEGASVSAWVPSRSPKRGRGSPRVSACREARTVPYSGGSSTGRRGRSLGTSRVPGTSGSASMRPRYSCRKRR